MRRLLIPLATLVLALMLIGGSPVQAQSPTIMVAPPWGYTSTVFTFTGYDFAPGAVLDEFYVGPDGNVYQYYVSGEPAVIIAGDDGSWAVDSDFENDYPGTWTVFFCYSGTSDCWTTTLDIYEG